MAVITPPKGRKVGIKTVQIMPIDTADGLLSVGTASGSVAYSGTFADGQSLNLNLPKPRKITHVGNDRPLDVDMLPPLEGMDGELMVSGSDFALDAQLSGFTMQTVGEAQIAFFGTDLQGYERQQCIIQNSQALTNGRRSWEFHILPLVYVVLQPSPSDENPEKRTYPIIPQYAANYPWGLALSAGSSGITRTQSLGGIGYGKALILVWAGNSSGSTFTFTDQNGTQYTALSTTAYDVFLVTAGVGVKQTTGLVKTTTGFTLTPAPATGTKLIAFIETT